MATLLLDRADLEVRCDGDVLLLYEAGVRRGSVPIRMIDRCVIQGARTRLDSGVLLKLAEAGIPTVLFSPRITRRVATLLGPLHQDASVRLAQALRVTQGDACLSWSRALVRAKLRRQRRLVEIWLDARPDARKPLHDARGRIDSAIASVECAAGIAELRGVEGAAARAHFSALSAVMPPELGFQGRRRRPPTDPVNAALSLAYSMLHMQAVQACHAAGLDPLLGFYHRPAFGRESLASDLIEALRPAADEWVWQQFRGRTLRDDHFTLDR